MTENIIYNEEISSNRTSAFFLVLTLIFLLLMLWSLDAAGLSLLSCVFIFFFLFFLFYTLNYRILHLRITSNSLQLKFGIFIWKVPLENIENCSLDELPWLIRNGGAGIHLMTIHGRYRASFNFLEYPRVVIAFKDKVGPVWDLSFSTRKPDEVIRHIQDLLEAS